MDDKHLKRAGLDYWDLVEIHYYDNLDELLEKYPDGDFYYSTTKTHNKYTDKQYKDNSFFVFGKETKGLPIELLEKNQDNCIRVPMINNIARSLNLANSVNIVLFEALRQLDFPYLG